MTIRSTIGSLMVLPSHSIWTATGQADIVLYFYARTNDILKIRGYRVSSGWLEDQFRPCPGILAAAAIGIPDKVSGERVAIFVQIAPDTPRKTVLNWRKMLPGYLRDVQIVFTTDSFPKNQNGKTDRRALRRMLEENP